MVLEDLRARIEGIATALVARNGTVLYADLPVEVHAETWAIMCATIVGAAVTANGEVGRAPPDRVVLDGADSRTVIVASGTQALLVATVPGCADLARVATELEKFADLLKDVAAFRADAELPLKGNPPREGVPQRSESIEF
jgi:predicted regulator of Ras-like GTPase activity (Roadblock/LC7/MglB family)